VPLVVTALFIVVAFTWGWLSDGPCRGARWPFIYVGAVITVGLMTEISTEDFH
jgi:ACS family pantothenate transporter-like MFS transporter